MNLRELSVKQWFFVLFGIALFVYIVFAIATRGETLILSHDTVPTMIFSDYFNSIFDSVKTYAESRVIYPPMTNLFYRLIAYMTVPFPTDARSLMDSFIPQFMMLASYAVLIGLLAINLNCHHKGNNKEKTILLLILILAYPIMHSIERGNNIGFAAMFVGLFIYLYDSEDVKKRYLGYLFLALAVNIKMYPIVFILLILRNKKTYEAIYFLIGTALIFFISLLMLNDSLVDFIANLFNTTNFGSDWGISISTPVRCVLEIFGCTQYTKPIAYTIMAVALIIVVYIAIKIENIERWKLIALVSITLCTCGTFNHGYCLFYMAVPLILFLGTNPEKNRMNIIYMLCFLCFFIPLIAFQYEGNVFTLYKYVNHFVPTIMMIVLFYDILSNYNNKKINTTNIQSV